MDFTCIIERQLPRRIALTLIDLSVLLCPSCGKRTLSFDPNSLGWVCKSCTSSYSGNREQIILGEVYSESSGILSPKKHRKAGLASRFRSKSWRSLNHEYLEKVFSDLPMESVILDFGSGPLTNSMYIDQYKVIYADGMPFDGVNIVCDFEKSLPIEEETFDYVLSSNVIEHMYDPVKYIKEAQRLLKKNGTLIITVPFAIKLHQEPLDFARYTKHFFEKVAYEEGFSAVSIKEMGSTLQIIRTILNAELKSLLVTNDMGAAIKKIALKVFLLTVYITDFAFKDNMSCSTFPQGYAVELIK